MCLVVNEYANDTIDNSLSTLLWQKQLCLKLYHGGSGWGKCKIAYWTTQKASLPEEWDSIHKGCCKYE